MALSTPAVARQGVPPADRRAGRSSLRLGGTVSPAAKPRAVAGQPGAHHRLSDIPTVQVADAGAPIVRPRAVELTADLPPEPELDHGCRRLGAARFIAFRRGQAVQSDRAPGHLDGVAVADMVDDAGQSAALALVGMCR